RRVPGGSSGGTAAAVAASLGAVGMGSDTCGSIRIPAAFNNLVGLRPSKGLGSIHGIMPLAHTQDVGGPLARSLADLAVVLDATSGHDPADAATAVVAGRPLPAFSAALGSIEPGGLRLGRLSPYMARADGATRAAIDAALDWYAEQGAEVIEVELAEALALIGVSGVIGHEFRSDLNQYLLEFGSDEIHSLSEVVALGLHHEAVTGVLARSIASARDEQAYAEALAARARLRAALESVLEEMDLDAIVYPVIAEQPVFIGSSQPGNNCSLSANSGLPALSLAVGFSAAGLPVGMELLGGFLDDARLLALAWPFEQALQPRRPPSVTPALTGAQAPAATSLVGRLGAGGLRVMAEFTVDSLRNRLRYRVDLSAGDSAALQALVLVIEGAEAGSNASIHASLLGPQQVAAEGEIFMSPALRQALTENRVTLKLFAAGADPAGVTAPLIP
ncbi:MAG: amidase, partial [Pseudohongiellaceae bacterium]